MQAAVECLATRGYSATSTIVVAKMADLTRTAMLYHFPSKAALMEAVVNYVTRVRVDMYGEAMADIPNDENYFDTAIDIAWAQTQTPEFQAFKELSTAARTDPEIAAVFTPALAEYDRARRTLAQSLFPENHVKKEWFDLRRDVVRFLLEGLADEGSAFAFNASQRHSDLINLLKVICTSSVGEELLKQAKNYRPSSGEGGRGRKKA